MLASSPWCHLGYTWPGPLSHSTPKTMSSTIQSLFSHLDSDSVELIKAAPGSCLRKTLENVATTFVVHLFRTVEHIHHHSYRSGDQNLCELSEKIINLWFLTFQDPLLFQSFLYRQVLEGLLPWSDGVTGEKFNKKLKWGVNDELMWAYVCLRV